MDAKRGSSEGPDENEALGAAGPSSETKTKDAVDASEELGAGEEAGLSAALSLNAGDVEEARGKDIQKALVGEIMMSMIDTEDKKTTVRAVVRLLFRMLRAWNDAHAVRLVIDAIHSLAAGYIQMRGEKRSLKVPSDMRSEFISQFLLAYATITSKLIKKSPADFKILARLFKWSIAFLKGCLSEFSGAVLGSKLPESQSRLLQALQGAPEALRLEARAAARAVMGGEAKEGKAVEALRKRYLDLVKSKPAKRTMLLSTFSLPVQPWMADAVCGLLTTSKPVSPTALTPYRHIIKSIKHPEFKSKVFPPLQQTLKRTPDVGIRTLASLVDHLSIDLSDYLSILAPFLLAEMTSEKARRRGAALRCLEAVSRRCSEAKVLGEAVNTKVGEMLTGKSGNPALPSWEARLALVGALQAMGKARAVGTKALKELSTRPILDLLSLMKKESHDEVRRAALDTIVGWTIHRKVVPAKVMARFTKGLASGGKKALDKNLVPEYLTQLLRLAKSGLFLPYDTKKAVKDQYDGLKSIVANGSESKTLRGTAVGALAILINPSIYDHANQVGEGSAPSPADQLKAWDGLLRDPKSILNQPDAVHGSSVQEALNQLLLASTLIEHHWGAAKPQPHSPYAPPAKEPVAKKPKKSRKKTHKQPLRKRVETKDPEPEDKKIWTASSLASPLTTSPYADFLKASLRLFVHPDPTVRRATHDEFQRLIKANSGVSSALLPSLLSLFDDLVQEQAMMKPVLPIEDDDDEPEPQSREALSTRARRAIICIAGSTPPLSSPPVLTALGCLCAHHPVVLRPTAWYPRWSVWALLVSRWKKGGRKGECKSARDCGAKALLFSRSSLCEVIFSVEGLRSPLRQRVDACKSLAVTLARVVPEVATGELLAAVLDLCRAADLQPLTPFQREIVMAGDGSWVDKTRFKKHRAMVATNNNIRKSSKLYSAEEEQWAREEMAKEAEAKLAAEEEKRRAVERVSQQALRTLICWQAVTPVRAALDIVASFARFCPEVTHDLILARVASAVRSLTTDSIVGEAATRAIYSLGWCLQVLPLARKQGAKKSQRLHYSLANRVSVSVTAVARRVAEIPAPDEKTSLESRAVAFAKTADFSEFLASGKLGSVAGTVSSLVAHLDGKTGEEDDEEGPKFMLSAQSFAFVLPVVQAVVASDSCEEKQGEKERCPDGISSAIDLLCKHTGEKLHASSGARYPCVQICALLAQLLASCKATPRSAIRRVRNAFFKIVQVLDPTEMGLLLGDVGTLSESFDMRLSAFNALVLRPKASLPLLGPLGNCRTWVGKFDSEDYIKRAAGRVWEEAKFILPEGYASEEYGLVALLAHSSANIRKAAGVAIAEAMKTYGKASETIDLLIKMFKESPDELVEKKLAPGEFDTEKEMLYRWPTRQAIAMCIAAACPYIMPDVAKGRLELQKLFGFFISEGFKDKNDDVWIEVLGAAQALVEEYGEKYNSSILPQLLGHLASNGRESKEAKKKDQEVADRVREGVVICLGNAARFIPAKSDKVGYVVGLLIGMLETPSYGVQVAASQCLVHLMPAVSYKAKQYVDSCVKNLGGPTFGMRKGAAFGLAGIIKGLGLGALKEYGILVELIKMVNNKGSYKVREGALFAYERLYATLGFRFEPYILLVLPHLLKAFGDSSKDVRKATQQAAQTIMANITSNGMKMVMPLVLRSLQDKKWRTKLESIGLLGSMAHCSTEQLSQALPTIVPKLLQAVSDPHEEVSRGARRALKQIGDVIQNPEIHAALAAILAALAKPQNTEAALKKLISTSFVHAIDAPSLALVVPILQRGLRDRGNKVKQMAAQITGSICTLISDISDILPYSARLIELVKAIICDNSPLVRKVAAQALGSLYKGLGEKEMPGILQFMLDILKGPTSAVQRSGGALGVAHLLVVMGTESVHKMLPMILGGVRDSNPQVREGFANLYVTLPEAFGQKFVPFVPGILESIISLLDDMSADVRSIALQAGHSIAMAYNQTNQIKSVLPSLEAGLKETKWRCRMGACHIIGTYLCQLGGSSGQVVVPTAEVDDHTDQNDDAKDGAKLVTSKMHKLMADKIGLPTRDRILSAIYLMRSDSIEMVANTSWRVWKAVVVNSPATLSSIFPTLINKIIASLASRDKDEQLSAGEALGGIVQKMGAAVLKEIVPLLQSRLNSEDEATRQGVCLGLREIMRSTSKKRIGDYISELISAVRDAICDESEDVRQAAGEAFETLHGIVGQKAVDEIVPALVKQLDAKAQDADEVKDEVIDTDLVLAGIKQILKTHSRLVLPFLIPQLSRRPLSLFGAQALASLSEVLGSSFYRYIEDVTRAFVDAIEVESRAGNVPRRNEFLEHAAKLNSCLFQDSVHALVSTLTEIIHNPKPDQGVHDKLAAIELVGRFAKESKCDMQHSLEGMLEAALTLFVSTDVPLLKQAAASLAVIIKHVTKNKIPDYIKFIMSVIHDVTHDQSGDQVFFELPGLNQRGALRPFIPLMTEGLMKGNEKTKEIAAKTMGTLVSLTAPAALNPYVMLITGPLIRMASEQFSEGVKLAILKALRLLLVKCGPRVKAFFSALQTTFRKALQHSSAAVRKETVLGLGHMMKHNPRVDNVVQDLVTQIAKEAMASIKSSMLQALQSVLSHKPTGGKVSKPLLQKVVTTTSDLTSHDDDEVREAASECFGTSLQYLEESEYGTMLNRHVLGAEALDEWEERQGRVLALAAVARTGKDLDAKSVRMVELLAKDDNVNVKVAAMNCAKSMLVATKLGEDDSKSLLGCLGKGVTEHKGAVQETAIQVLQAFAHFKPEACEKDVAAVVSPLVEGFEKAKGDQKYEIRMALYLVCQLNEGKEAAEKRCSTITKSLKKSVAKAFVAMFKKMLPKVTKLEYESRVKSLTR